MFSRTAAVSGHSSLGHQMSSVEQIMNDPLNTCQRVSFYTRFFGSHSALSVNVRCQLREDENG